jgi:hypothetical protein
MKSQVKAQLTALFRSTIDVTLTLPTTPANGGGSNVVQILLIVLVVVLAIGLIITFIVLVRHGR